MVKRGPVETLPSKPWGSGRGELFPWSQIVEQTSSLCPEEDFLPAFVCYSLKAQPGLKSRSALDMKRCPWGIARLRPCLLGSAPLGKPASPGCCPPSKPGFPNSQQHSCPAGLPELRTAHAPLVWPGPSLQSRPKGNVKFTSNLRHTNKAPQKT